MKKIVIGVAVVVIVVGVGFGLVSKNGEAKKKEAAEFHMKATKALDRKQYKSPTF